MGQKEGAEVSIEAEAACGPEICGETPSEVIKQGLLEMFPDGSGRVPIEELYRMATTLGDKMGAVEAKQAISLLPKEEGRVSVQDLIGALFGKEKEE